MPFKSKKKNRDFQRSWRARRRDAAVLLLGGYKCVNCGCTEKSILEVNHINGGGNQQSKGRSNIALCNDIVIGRVDLGDYDIRCRVCNALHYVEEILGIEGHEVRWNKE